MPLSAGGGNLFGNAWERRVPRHPVIANSIARGRKRVNPRFFVRSFRNATTGMIVQNWRYLYVDETMTQNNNQGWSSSGLSHLHLKKQYIGKDCCYNAVERADDKELLLHITVETDD